MENNTKGIGDWSVLQRLKPFLQEAWKHKGFQKPTMIQEKAVPLILEGKDVISESPTGTGKTITYLLPLLERIDLEKKVTQAIIIAPSRELVMQIYEEIQRWAQGSEITSASFIGGANIKLQLEKIKKHPQIVVGTTGRLLELIKMKKLKMHNVKMIVVDEFDMLIVQDHIENVQSIIKATQKERQLLFFSATLSKENEQLAKRWMKDPQVIRIEKKKDSESNVEHIYFVSELRDKIDVLRRIMRIDGIKALAFINDMEKMFEVQAKLKYKGIASEVLNGESSKGERQQALRHFREGKVALLLATDVAARGLDIEGLNHVIHFDFPHDTKQYIHRSGRTGRMNALGTVISIVTKREESFLKKLSRASGILIQKKVIYHGKISDQETLL
ncbi:DEAD/DEAH box helicase [Tepidibacillus decaturensis]|uniref:RNA helicase n=1 Tax=Tepidibacillus decaturensis TaxID=1413211 RepID=A0A135L6Y2_9BACI|nr:DEAD/DEAH box helicase [Tepidibacillus decaturensis]KXG44730.1 RNA helicase [Tepidibacillus decaturensis]